MSILAKTKLFLAELKGLIPVLVIPMGLILIVFSLWQLDVILISKVWGTCASNISTYQDYIAQGLIHYSDRPFTISAELFREGGPFGTTGFWYDALMSMVIVGWFISMIGMYFYHSIIVEKVKGIKKALKWTK